MPPFKKYIYYMYVFLHGFTKPSILIPSLWILVWLRFLFVPNTLWWKLLQQLQHRATWERHMVASSAANVRFYSLSKSCNVWNDFDVIIWRSNHVFLPRGLITPHSFNWPYTLKHQCCMWAFFSFVLTLPWLFYSSWQWKYSAAFH